MKIETYKESENTATMKISELTVEQQEKVKEFLSIKHTKNIDAIPLTYELLALNFPEDTEIKKTNLDPHAIYRTEKYCIGAELVGGCDCMKHLTVFNVENKFESEIRDSEKSQLKQYRKFTVGDLKTLLRIVGLNDVADNFKITEVKYI